MPPTVNVLYRSSLELTKKSALWPKVSIIALIDQTRHLSGFPIFYGESGSACTMENCSTPIPLRSRSTVLWVATLLTSKNRSWNLRTSMFSLVTNTLVWMLRRYSYSLEVTSYSFRLKLTKMICVYFLIQFRLWTELKVSLLIHYALLSLSLVIFFSLLSTLLS